MNYVYFESLCKQKQTTPTALLEELGLSKGNLNSWRRGGNPSIDVAVKICEQLNCTLDDLIGIDKPTGPDGEQPAPTIFFARLELRCHQMNTSPSATALKIGLSNASVTKWKNGSIPRYETLSKLANELDCTVDFLTGRVDDPRETWSQEKWLNQQRKDSFLKLAEEIKKATPDGGWLQEDAFEVARKFSDLSPENKARMMDYLALLVGNQDNS